MDCPSAAFISKASQLRRLLIASPESSECSHIAKPENQFYLLLRCAILEDVTIFGLSLPKAWLGGLNGENLLGKAAGERNGAPILRGVKSLHVEPGALVLEVED